MTKLEKLYAAAKSLSDAQVDALISFARSMKEKPFYDEAPPEALQSIERGLSQIESGQTITLEELSRRLARAARAGNK